MKKRQISLVLSLACLVFFGGGCLLVAVGAGAAGTVAYVRGDLESVLDADMNKAYTASLTSLKQLELVPTLKQKDALGAKIIARTTEDKKVTITLTRVDEKLTKLSIRIGIFGDEMQSRVIYDRIRGNLK